MSIPTCHFFSPSQHFGTLSQLYEILVIFFFLDETGSSATFVAEEKKVFPHFLTRTLSLCLVSCEGTLDSANVYSLDLETVHSWSFAETAQSLVWSSKKSYLISSRSKFG